MVHSPYFLCLNRNKRSITLNLRSETGHDIFMSLAKDADVVVEGFRPGVVDRLGIGYEAVREANRRIVYCAISGYGQDGPYRLRAGHDVNYCSYAGVTDQIELPAARPSYRIFRSRMFWVGVHPPPSAFSARSSTPVPAARGGTSTYP